MDKEKQKTSCPELFTELDPTKPNLDFSKKYLAVTPEGAFYFSPEGK